MSYLKTGFVIVIIYLTIIPAPVQCRWVPPSRFMMDFFHRNQNPNYYNSRYRRNIVDPFYDLSYGDYQNGIEDYPYEDRQLEAESSSHRLFVPNILG